VWTYLGFHAQDSSDPDNPRIVHGFLHRDTPGYRIEETWDTMGMRATMSNDTILDRTFVPDEATMLVTPAGFAGAGLFHVALFGWALLGFAGVYASIAQRAFDDTVTKVHQRSSVALTRSMAYHPEVQHEIADIALALEGSIPHVERTAADWSNGVDHGGMWPMKLVATKHHAVEAAKRAVDLALEVSGGAGMFTGQELERLYRDVRCGGFHPANSALTHEIVGKTMVGVLGEEPRW